jgi:GcrA cell cycle regulator
MIDAAITWTEERVELLKRLWADGRSASQIAAEIGGCSRNAVIGKVHRLGLSGRVKPGPTGDPKPRKVERPAGAPAPEPVAAPAPGPARPALELVAETGAAREVAAPVSERVTIMELRESMCRWPMGDPTAADFRFCGCRTIPGLPYCTHHAQVAYQPVADRRRDRRVAGL